MFGALEPGGPSTAALSLCREARLEIMRLRAARGRETESSSLPSIVPTLELLRPIQGKGRKSRRPAGPREGRTPSAKTLGASDRRSSARPCPGIQTRSEQPGNPAFWACWLLLAPASKGLVPNSALRCETRTAASSGYTRQRRERSPARACKGVAGSCCSWTGPSRRNPRGARIAQRGLPRRRSPYGSGTDAPHRCKAGLRRRVSTARV